MKEIKILLIANIFCVSAMMAFLAVIGPIIRALHLEEWHAGLSVSIAGIIWIIFSPYWGKRSDIIGRKPILLIGVSGVAFSYLLLALFIDYALYFKPSLFITLIIIVFLRGIIGGFYAAITPVSNAFIADHVTKDKRTAYIAKLAASSGLAMVLGPILGGYLAQYGLNIPLYIFSLLPLLAAISIYYKIPHEKPTFIKKVTKVNLVDQRLYIPMFAAFISMVSIVTVQVCIGFYILDVFLYSSLNAAKITGYILACIGVVFFLSQMWISKTSINAKKLLLYGSFISCFGYSFIAFQNSLLIFTLGLSIGIFGLGMIFPAFQTLAINAVDKNEQGAASGTVSAAQGIGMTLGPLLSTIIYKITPLAPFIFVAIIFAILAFITFKFYTKIK